MIYHKKWFNILFLVTFSLFGRLKKHNVQLEFVREYDGKTFYQKEANYGGKVNKIFKIDEKPVSKDFFDHEIAEAKKEDWIKKEKEKERNRIEDLDFCLSNKIKINKKIFSLELQKCKKLIGNIDLYNLYDYCVFGSNSFTSSNEYDHFVDNLLPELENVTLSSFEVDLNILNNLSNKLENYANRLKKFFKDALEKAIDTCDDTKKLKKLMKLLEQD